MYSYRHGIPAEQTSWEVRKALLQQEISIANCDVVCFQEVSADSFDSDFSFMGELGFDRSEIYKRGRFRPATFWKSARVETVAASLHRDRVLVIPFRRVRGEGEQTTQTVFVTSQQEQGCQGQESISLPPLLPEIQLPLYVANCHLQVVYCRVVSVLCCTSSTVLCCAVLHPVVLSLNHITLSYRQVGWRALSGAPVATSARRLGKHPQRGHENHSVVLDIN